MVYVCCTVVTKIYTCAVRESPNNKVRELRKNTSQFMSLQSCAKANEGFFFFASFWRQRESANN